MHSPFFLISAALASGEQEDPTPPRLIAFNRPHSPGTWGAPFSVIIGKNGSGKSRLLSAIASCFIILEEIKQSPRKKYYRRLPLDTLIYSINGKEVSLSMSGYNIVATLDGGSIPLEELPLPSRVIAVTMSAFDKFPLMTPKQARTAEIYRYMGLRDRTGRASSTRLLSELILNMFQEVGGVEERSRRARIGDTMVYLGFEPTILVTYRLRISRRSLEALAGVTPKEELRPYESNEMRRIRAFAEHSGESAAEFDKDVRQVVRWLEGGRVRAGADFSDLAQSYSKFKVLNRLRQAGAFTIDDIEVKHPSEAAFDLKEASSGEQTMLALFVGLAATLLDTSLVLIDEPETSLHPQWQSEFIKRIMSSFENFSGIDYLLATHSPLIISDLPEGTHVHSLDREPRPFVGESRVAGASSDLILAELFESPGRRNLHVRDEIARAFRLLAIDQDRSEEYSRALRSLAGVLENTPEGDPSIPVIRELLALRRR